MAAGAGGPFELVILDPPYHKGLTAPALTSLRDGGWLCPNALAVVETAEDEDIETPAGYTQLDERVYGDTRVRLLKQG
jgi:16S rRNA (guanine966-N2)-methyltransferase